MCSAWVFNASSANSGSDLGLFHWQASLTPGLHATTQRLGLFIAQFLGNRFSAHGTRALGTDQNHRQLLILDYAGQFFFQQPGVSLPVLEAVEAMALALCLHGE